MQGIHHTGILNEVITITFKSDIYSLGTIIVEMLTGRKGLRGILTFLM
jgi:serine/threonine protein kinase